MESLVDLLHRSARDFADHPALVLSDRTLSYPEFEEATSRVSASLVARGLAKGDRVGLYCLNSDLFAIAYFAILKAGGTVVPINLLLNPREVIYILRDCGARGLVYHEALSEAVTAVRQGVESLSVYVCAGRHPNAPSDLPWQEALHADPLKDAPALQPEEDVAAIIYTSGTTGHPKGAMLTHHNLASNTRSVRKALDVTPGADAFLTVLPMFHSFAATAGMLSPLFAGCRVIPLPKFDPVLVADTVAAKQATIFMGVPSMYGTFLRLPEEYTEKFRTLRFCVSGGAAMPEEILRQFERRFGKLIYEGDGPTECSPVTCCNPIGGKRKIGSVGVAVPDVQMKILDDQGQELPKGRIGEICVRGPNVMKGYWQQPEATREAFFGDWFRTGDLGTEDEEGYFFIVDRKKDMIIVNGMNVYPRVVEEVLYQFDPIHEAAVVGQPSERHGEVPIAFVSLKPGKETSEAAVKAFCRDHLGRHEVPRKVIILPALPKNATGKILKRELRKGGEVERGVDLA